jgi:beta-glucosidase
MDLNKNRERIKVFKAEAKRLVSQMTIEEKVYQTVNASSEIKRLGIKSYDWWNEALHGVARAGTATVFPQAIALAATFDEEFVEKAGDAVSTEGRAKFHMQQEYEDYDMYKGLSFWAPNINIFRDPRWGRGHETFGEDPYLTSRMGVRYIEGLQGHDENYLKSAACAKHMAVHSGPESLRHSFNAVVSKKDLYETYLPAFQACVQEAGVESVMGAYNRINGEPCCGSKTLLQDILRDKWGFDGHVVSDCYAIRDFHENHHITATPQESAAMAMNNGCDLNCGKMFLYLLDAVNQGTVSEERINEAVERLMVTRMKLGILGNDEKTNPYKRIPYEVVDSKEMKLLNREAACKSIVLLKNDNHMLPLNPGTIGTIGVIGPNADSRKALVGNYEGTASRYRTVLEGIQDAAGENTRVLFSEGCPLISATEKQKKRETRRFSEVRAICKASDMVVACMGLDAMLEGEQGDTGNEFPGGDKPDLNLPDIQNRLLEIIMESGKPVILLLLSGSAMSVTWADKHIPAILQCWYPGAEGGSAIADILFGIRNPEGRLPVTFYRTTEELPAFEDYSMKGRTYRFMENEALYPFGYGLSYTCYEYRNEALSHESLTEEGVVVSVDVSNIGEMAGKETVQVYVEAEGPDTPNPQLKGIKKVYLEPHERKNVEIYLPYSAFCLFDEEGKKYWPHGYYRIFVGGSQPDKRSQSLLKSNVRQLYINNNGLS